MSCKCQVKQGESVVTKAKPNKRICHCKLTDEEPVKDQSCTCTNICSLTDSRQGCQPHRSKSTSGSSSSSEDGDGRTECVCTQMCNLETDREGCTDHNVPATGQGGPARKNYDNRSDTSRSSRPLPNQSSFSMDSSDLQYMEQVRNLVQEDSRLKKELDDLTTKEQLMHKTMEMWHRVSASEAPTNADQLRERDPEIVHLRRMNKELGDVNETLTDQLEDLLLEQEQVDQRIYGPLTRELDRLKRKDIQVSEELAKSIVFINSITREVEVSTLREQVKRTKGNIQDLSMVNDGIKNEVIVINYRCSQMETLLIDQKKGEIEAINKMSTLCDCDEGSNNKSSSSSSDQCSCEEEASLCCSNL